MGNQPEIQKIYPLSPMQEGMLFYALLDQQATTYFEQMDLTIEGELDQEWLETGFNLLMERFETFRTNFVTQKVQKPRQVVFKVKKAVIPWEDISSRNEFDKARFIEDYKAQDRRRGFDLLRDNLIRAAVIRTGPDSYRVIWSFHHIIMDGWCMGIVFKDFLEIYQSLKNNSTLSLEPVPPYSDYINWLEEYNNDKAYQYWRNYLSDYGKPVTLPNYGKKPGKGNYQLGVIQFRLDQTLTQGLEKIANENQVTLNIVFQSLWGLLLQRYNNVDDAVFGAVVSGRPPEIPNIERMVGLFINTIPVRVQSKPGDSFMELLRRVEEAMLISENYVYCSLADIQGNTDLKQELFDQILVFENYPLEKGIGAHVRQHELGFYISDVTMYEQTNYNLDVVVVPEQELSVQLNYNQHVYEPEIVAGIEGHLQTIARQIIRDPNRPLAGISLLTELEQQRIIFDFNQTGAVFPQNQTIHQWFEDQAAENPEQTAVVYGSRQLTYRELNARANRLAKILRAKGTLADTIIGLLSVRSPEIIIGILAILKAGGAFLPIDPEFPAERINYLLTDSGARFLLTQPEYLDKFGFTGETIVFEAANFAVPECSNLENISHPENLVYVIYTSGTTGQPKGVQLEHRNLANYVHWFKNKVRLTGGDKSVLLSSYAFDLSYTSLFPTLLSGGELHIVDKACYAEPDKLLDYLDQHSITYIKGTPSLFNMLMNACRCGMREGLQSLRLVVLGGEAINVKDIEWFHHWRPRCRIMNHYGPTEATIGSIAQLIDFEELAAYHQHPAIGNPVANARVYILDKHLNHTPVGVPGEIHIAGAGLARNYLNCPDLNAQKFIAAANCQLSNDCQLSTVNCQLSNDCQLSTKRMYRTGDLGVYLPGGRIEFLGRMDNQVKIRGYRVELGEIESRLLDYPTVTDAVVIPKPTPKAINTFVPIWWPPKQLPSLNYGNI